MTVLFLCMLFFSTLVKLSTSSPSSDCATCNPGNITFYAEMDFSGASESKHITWGQCDQVPAPDTLGDTGSSWQVSITASSLGISLTTLRSATAPIVFVPSSATTAALTRTYGNHRYTLNKGPQRFTVGCGKLPRRTSRVKSINGSNVRLMTQPAMAAREFRTKAAKTLDHVDARSPAGV